MNRQHLKLVLALIGFALVALLPCLGCAEDSNGNYHDFAFPTPPACEMTSAPCP